MPLLVLWLLLLVVAAQSVVASKTRARALKTIIIVASFGIAAYIIRSYAPPFLFTRPHGAV